MNAYSDITKNKYSIKEHATKLDNIIKNKFKTQVVEIKSHTFRVNDNNELMATVSAKVNNAPATCYFRETEIMHIS